MNRVRGGVFSGAMVLAGISATLISALIAIGMRQVTNPAGRPTPIYVQPASGSVAVPDAQGSLPAPRPATSAVPSTVAAPGLAVARQATTRHSTARQNGGTTTGSVTSGGSVAPPPSNPGQQPATAGGSGSTPASSASPSPSASSSASASPSPSASSHGNGNANGNGNGNGGNGHHP